MQILDLLQRLEPNHLEEFRRHLGTGILRVENHDPNRVLLWNL